MEIKFVNISTEHSITRELFFISGNITLNDIINKANEYDYLEKELTVEEMYQETVDVFWPNAKSKEEVEEEMEHFLDRF